MLTSIELCDFQAHKSTLLSFDKGVNIIRGTSDSGKSSILRALKWLITNTPTGDGFIRDGKEAVEVSLHFDDSVVVRGKNKKSNYYKLGKEVFEGFGTSVPIEIADLINFADINMQNQIDLPFLIARSSGEVARYLNEIVEMDDIDLCLKNLASTRKKELSSIQHVENEVKSLSEKISNFSYLDEVEILLNEATVFAKEINVIEANLLELDNFLSELDEAASSLDGVKDYSGITEYIEAALSLEKEASVLEERNSDLYDLMYEVKHEAHIMEISLKNLVKYKSAYKKAMPDICPLCGK